MQKTRTAKTILITPVCCKYLMQIIHISRGVCYTSGFKGSVHMQCACMWWTVHWLNATSSSDNDGFGIHGTALNWFSSYLSSRCFRVKCNNDFSSSHTCLCGVPQGSVLGPLLFVMYTTPLSTLISSLFSNHHLYTDDTQLFLSFHPSDLNSQHHSLTKRSTTDVYLDDCQSCHSQLF